MTDIPTSDMDELRVTYLYDRKKALDSGDYNRVDNIDKSFVFAVTVLITTHKLELLDRLEKQSEQMSEIQSTAPKTYGFRPIDAIPLSAIHQERQRIKGEE